MRLFYFILTLSLSASAVNGDDLAALRQNCVACHGGVTDGKRTTEGSFDITPLLKDGIQERHTSEWVKVVDQLRDGEMPPADTAYRLSAAQRQSVINQVFTTLDRSEIQERLLTPFEIANTYAEVFGLDRDIYDPFQSLFFLENIDSAYPTINSPSLMSAAYLREIEAGLDLTLEHTVANRFTHMVTVDGFQGGSRKQKGQTRFELRFGINRTSQDRTGVTYLAYLHQVKLPVSNDRIKNTADQEERNRLKAINGEAIQKHQKWIEETQNLDPVDLRMRGSNRLSCREYGVNLPVGRYRLTFKASALNRDLVDRVAAAPKKGKASDLGTFRELLGAKAGLAIRHGGINASRRGGVAAHSKSGKLIRYFEIEDDVKREFTCDFQLTIPGQIEMDFVNGPWNDRVNRLNLGGKSGKEEDPDKYGLPCIRIHSKIILDRLGDLEEARIPYQIVEGNTAEQLQRKLEGLASELSLDSSGARLAAIRDRFDPSFSSEQRYTQALKWIAMSPEQLYVRYDSKDAVASARYVSYALLKKHPDDSFKGDYKRFRSGTLSAEQFAERIVADPGFADFLSIFVRHWLENRTVLDETKFGRLELALPYASETEHYLRHMFVQNRSTLELVVSDYQTLSAPMASFYGKRADGLDRHTPAVVATPGKGGLLHQAHFFVARSDGVDPRPFSRAAWIAKNVFGQTLAEPPGDINADQFTALAKTATFKERVAVHSQIQACASCHQKIDPIAFAVNDYDTIGRVTGRPDVEAKRNLESRVHKAGRTMAESFTRHLVAFSIGRDTNLHDMKAIESILESTKDDGHRVRDILAEILKVHFRS